MLPVTSQSRTLDPESKYTIEQASQTAQTATTNSKLNVVHNRRQTFPSSLSSSNRNYVRKLQSVRARLARQQRVLKPRSRRAALHLRGPPDDQRGQSKCYCSRFRPRFSGRSRSSPRPERDGIPHHRLPSERVERVGRRRARTPMVQDRHGRAATAAAHRLLRRPATHRRDRRLGRQSSERGNAWLAATAISTNLASHWA